MRLYGSTGNVSITFQINIATYGIGGFGGGGAVGVYGSTGDVSITYCTFQNNSAVDGGGGAVWLYGLIGDFSITYCTFTNNSATHGGAVMLGGSIEAIFFLFKNPALEGSACIIVFIYDDPQIQNDLPPLHIQLPPSVLPTHVHHPEIFSITFINNHAVQSDHAIYATPIYNCNNDCNYIYFPDCNDGPNLTSYFTITSLPGDSSDLQIVTSPTDVHLCGCSGPKFCNVTSQGKVTTYPGGTVRLNVTSVGAGNTLSPSVVYTKIDTSSITSQNITLGPRQEAQWIRTVCGTIEYQIYGPEMASAKQLLFNDPINSQAVIEVELLPCGPGFIVMSDFSTGVIKCGCSLFFTSRGVVCDTSDGTVTRNDNNNWIGVYNNTLPALASTCPLDYCNTAINRLSLSRSGDLCNGGRTGILCGHCHSNHSVIFGSFKCQVCTDMWLITLVMFAVLGVLLVAALFFLNLTVTQGTLYGLIFYANIIQVNHSIFFSQSILNPMKVIVSFVNLDLGLPLCFYDGMDDADKAGLQFVFPAYLLILTMTVIVLCHYCLQRSPTSSTSSCWYRFPIIIGERAVGVLSTLIYLSYSKLLRTVIDILTYSTVHLPTGDMYVWFYDGNVKYLHGKHTL